MKETSIRKIGLTSLAVLLTGGALLGKDLKFAPGTPGNGPVVPGPAPLAKLASGTITTYAGGPGRGPATSFGQFVNSVAINGNRVFTTDVGAHVVRVLNAKSGNQSVAAGNLTPGFSGDGGPAIRAQLGFFNAGVAVDAAGNLYITDRGGFGTPGGNSRIRRVDTSGNITTVAGNGTPGYSGDGGPATAAQLNFPFDVAVDSVGNLYIADSDNGVIRKVDTSGIISTVADGFFFATGVAIDSLGDVYISDYLQASVFKLDVDRGVVRRVAGRGESGYDGDGGPARNARLNLPFDVAFDSAGNFYVADSGNSAIRKVDRAGIITTVAGNGTAGFSGDGGQATAAQLNNPTGVAVDSTGKLHIADSSNFRLRTVSTTGVINTVAGTGGNGAGPDGGPPPTRIELSLVEGVTTSPDGSIYVAAIGNSTVRKISSAGVVTTVAGNGIYGYGGDGGPATSAFLSGDRDVALDAGGNLYIADTDNNRIRKVDTTGIITTFAGTGVAGFSGDGGPASAAQISGPRGVEIDTAGNLYIADSFNSCVRKVTRAGRITTVAGMGGVFGNSGDGGPATSALLGDPEGVAFDAAGNYYITDFSNCNVRKVDSNGIITKVAGTGVCGFSGDGGPATGAQFLNPIGIEVDSVGNILIADTFNNRVRKIDGTGIITTFAGSGLDGNSQGGFGGDGGQADAALLNAPIGVALDANDNLFIGDFVNQRIRRVQGPGLP